MRNTYPGICYLCGDHVAGTLSHFEWRDDGWRVRHFVCTNLYLSDTPLAWSGRGVTNSEAALAHPRYTDAAP